MLGACHLPNIYLYCRLVARKLHASTQSIAIITHIASTRTLARETHTRTIYAVDIICIHEIAEPKYTYKHTGVETIPETEHHIGGHYVRQTQIEKKD